MVSEIMDTDVANETNSVTPLHSRSTHARTHAHTVTFQTWMIEGYYKTNINHFSTFILDASL